MKKVYFLATLILVVLFFSCAVLPADTDTQPSKETDVSWDGDVWICPSKAGGFGAMAVYTYKDPNFSKSDVVEEELLTNARTFRKMSTEELNQEKSQWAYGFVIPQEVRKDTPYLRVFIDQSEAVYIEAQGYPVETCKTVLLKAYPVRAIHYTDYPVSYLYGPSYTKGSGIHTTIEGYVGVVCPQ